MTSAELLDGWRDAVLRAREALAEIDRVQAQAHMVLVGRDGRMARRYKQALLDALLPVERAMEEYVARLEELWAPAAMLLRSHEEDRPRD